MMEEKKWITLILCIALFLLIFQASTFAEEQETEKLVYVAPNGNDDGQGTIEDPFKTAHRALEEMKQFSGRKSIVFRGGDYYFTETLVIDLETYGNNVHLSAYPGETPVFTSGMKLENFRKLNKTDHIWESLTSDQREHIRVAEIPEEMNDVENIVDKYSHWVDRGRVDLSSNLVTHRNERKLSIEAEMWLPSSEKQVAYFNVSIDKYADTNYEKDLLMRIYSSDWNTNLLPVKKIIDKLLLTEVAGTYKLVAYEFGEEKAAWLENVIEGVDNPNKWVINSFENKLYIWPAREDFQVSIPLLDELIRIEGSDVDPMTSLEKPIKDITIKGITFTNGNRPNWEKNDAGAQHDWAMLDKGNALLRFRGVDNSLVTECNFTKSGGVGVRYDLYAKNNQVIDNNFSYLGCEAIHFGGYGIGVKDDNRDNIIKNNEIHHIGMIKWDAPAIVIWNSGYNTISGNIIHDIPEKAILLSAPRSRSFTKETPLREQAWSLARWFEMKESDTTRINRDGSELVGNEMTFDEEIAQYYRFNRGNTIEENTFYNVLSADGIIYITAQGIGGANRIVGNNFVNMHMSPSEGMVWPQGEEISRNQYLIFADGFLGDLVIQENIFAYSESLFWPIFIPLWYGEGDVSSNVFYKVEANYDFVENYINPGFAEDEDYPVTLNLTKVYDNIILDDREHDDDDGLSSTTYNRIIKRLSSSIPGITKKQQQEIYNHMIEEY
ncbi:right-handed parallel beta-helix repeat-containing protein [Anaeromicrobium sediminis]|uniref:Right handed beta helix domain-containing protein n=1 Tax=Anaeromicrobium sediminis TaxID=1478221 RepID=A0A267MGY4_9FIRM|nr:right-handed parallel beta-helix repeat-containing protein [Anaeromicrobium sediminis]PAB58806.1 hypothetical protein CCE28_12990 [Anaeromicrobium sediminis]